MFTCRICNREFGQITGKHLRTHGLSTVSEYKAMFPTAQTFRERVDSVETLEKKRIARTGKKHTQDTKDKIGLKHKGKTRSPEEIDKWRVSYAQFLEENGSPMLGKDRGEDFKKHMSEVAKNRPPELVREKVEQMWAARRGSKATPEQRKTYSDARIKYIEDNPDNIPDKLFNTRPEREFAKMLDKLLMAYKRNFNVAGRLYDFKVGDDILIEIDGPYHWNFKMYGNRTMSDEERLVLFNEAKKNDIYKNELAKLNGYKLYRIKVEGCIPNDWKEQLLIQGCDVF